MMECGNAHNLALHDDASCSVRMARCWWRFWLLSLGIMAMVSGCSDQAEDDTIVALDTEQTQAAAASSRKLYGHTAMATGTNSLMFLQRTVGTGHGGASCEVASGQEIAYTYFRLTRGGFEVKLAKALQGCQGMQFFFPISATSYASPPPGGATTMMSGDTVLDTSYHLPQGYIHQPQLYPQYHHPGVDAPSLNTENSIFGGEQAQGQQELVFPLFSFPLEEMTTGGREFGASRDGGHRRHAANDLVEYPGNPVYAVADGRIIDYYEFYYASYAVVVDHGGFVVRYGEISQLWKGVQVGDYVKAGQKIGVVSYLHMLHFEKFKGTHYGPLTDRRNYPYQRREDLVKPTDFLQLIMNTGSFPATW